MLKSGLVFFTSIIIASSLNVGSALAASACSPILTASIVTLEPGPARNLRRNLLDRYPESRVSFIEQKLHHGALVYEFRVDHPRYSETITLVAPGPQSPANRLAKEMWESGVITKLTYLFDFRPSEKILMIREGEISDVKKVQVRINEITKYPVPQLSESLEQFQERTKHILDDVIQNLGSQREFRKKELVQIGVEGATDWWFSPVLDPQSINLVHEVRSLLASRPNVLVRDVVILKTNPDGLPIRLQEMQDADTLWVSLPQEPEYWGAGVKYLSIDFGKESLNPRVFSYPGELDIE